MRKSIIKLLSIGALSFVLLGSAKIDAATTTVTKDGITWAYTLVDGKATNVYVKSGAKSNLTIPEKLNGYTVVSVGGGDSNTPVSDDAETVMLPATVTEINDYAFSNSNLNTINIENVKTIGCYAFSGTLLDTITLKGGIVKKSAFCDSALEDVFLIGSMDVGSNAFADCDELSKLDLSSFTGNLGESSFQNCTSLEELYVGNITSLGAYAFKGCTGLKNLEINYPHLENQFEDCLNLENIVLDEDVQDISACTFMCHNGASLQEIPKKYNYTAQLFDYAKVTQVQDYSIANAIANKTSYTSYFEAKKERNWYFKNENTKFEQFQISTTNSGSYYEGRDDERCTCRGDIYNYTTSITSSLYPSMQSQYFGLRRNNDKEVYLVYGYGLNLEKDTGDAVLYDSGNSTEYANTTEGYAINNIFVNCSQDASVDDIENLQNAAVGSVYEEMASQTLRIYDTKKEMVAIPSYIPEKKITEINAEYDGTVVEGSEINLDNLKITLSYNDGEFKTVSYDQSTMMIEGNIELGQNTLALTAFNGLTCNFIVTGVAKAPENPKTSNTPGKNVISTSAPGGTYVYTEEISNTNDNDTSVSKKASTSTTSVTKKKSSTDKKKLANATSVAKSKAPVNSVKSIYKKKAAITSSKSGISKKKTATSLEKTRISQKTNYERSASSLNNDISDIPVIVYEDDVQKLDSSDKAGKNEIEKDKAKEKEKSPSKSNGELSAEYEGINDAYACSSDMQNVQEADTKDTSTKEEKSSSFPVLVVALIVIIIIVSALIMNRKRRQDEDDVDESEFVNEDEE